MYAQPALGPTSTECRDVFRTDRVVLAWCHASISSLQFQKPTASNLIPGSRIQHPLGKEMILKKHKQSGLQWSIWAWPKRLTYILAPSEPKRPNVLQEPKDEIHKQAPRPIHQEAPSNRMQRFGTSCRSTSRGGVVSATFQHNTNCPEYGSQTITY